MPVRLGTLLSQMAQAHELPTVIRQDKIIMICALRLVEAEDRPRLQPLLCNDMIEELQCIVV